ncbi:YceI family protein [Streptomyces telluris]|uniref:YceI family protein n=1 Tax=Streptomyces telluris TaxID=2720021 RepID=A0A9X2RMS2_9ACTN|nr:YceI family protein [Streptomyces telluris]MCQ8769666.1 YceI family protein [Streptomyces telluris]NJP77716.1 PEGA domain-containing protein [Streptomyces telluris]
MAFALLRRFTRPSRPEAAPIPLGAGALDCIVVEPMQSPLHRAEVSVRDAGGREVVRGQTDPHGRFATTVAPGEYSVSVTAEGFRPVLRTVTCTEETRTSLGTLAMELAPAPPMPAPGAWRIDPDHTAVRFIARHIGLAEVHGRFNRFEGTLWITEDLRHSRIDVVIDTASIDTGVAQRDEHLRSPEFLDVANYPYMQFTSEHFVHRGGSHWTVQGVLNLHGVSRNIALDTRYLGLGTGIMGETRTACSASTELHREDFTLDWRSMLRRGIAMIGATIRIELDIQAVPEQQPPAG